MLIFIILFPCQNDKYKYNWNNNMTIEVIDIGLLPNDGTGDPIRVAFDKINNNFASIPLLNIDGPNTSILFNANGQTAGDANLLYDTANNVVRIDANIIPTTDDVVSIGNSAVRIANLWLNKSNSFHIGNVGASENANVVNLFLNANNQLQADLQIGNIYSTGDIYAIGNVTSTGNVAIIGGLTLSNIIIDSSNVSTTSNTANQVVYETQMTGFTTMRVQMTTAVPETNDSQTASMTINKRNDGASAKYTIFGTMFYGTPLTRYNVDMAYGNVRIMVSPIPNQPMYHITSRLVDIN
jgi:hypothetical protein